MWSSTRSSLGGADEVMGRLSSVRLLRHKTQLPLRQSYSILYVIKRTSHKIDSEKFKFDVINVDFIRSSSLNKYKRSLARRIFGDPKDFKERTPSSFYCGSRHREIK